MSYSGIERRIHKTYITLNSEYHVRAGVCVAVRDRDSGAWISGHEAIGMHLESTRPPENSIGGPILFGSDYVKVRTSRVLDLFRPNRQMVELYTLLLSKRVSPAAQNSALLSCSDE